MKAPAVTAVLVALGVTVGVAWETETFRMKGGANHTKIFFLDGKLLIGIGQSALGWQGSALATYIVRAGEVLGVGTFPPTHQRFDLRIWYIEEERCRGVIVQDRSHHSLYAVEDRLLLIDGNSWDHWTGTGFEPLTSSDQAALDARIEDRMEAEGSSEWQVRELNLFELGTQEVQIGKYVVRASYTEPRVGVFFDNVIELQLLTRRGEVLCALKESRGLWRRVEAAEFRQLFGDDTKLPYPGGT